MRMPIDQFPSRKPGASRPMIGTPATTRQMEVLRSARDARGSLGAVSARLRRAAAALVLADLLEVDVVGFSLTAAGIIFLAECEEIVASDILRARGSA